MYTEIYKQNRGIQYVYTFLYSALLSENLLLTCVSPFPLFSILMFNAMVPDLISSPPVHYSSLPTSGLLSPHLPTPKSILSAVARGFLYNIVLIPSLP